MRLVLPVTLTLAATLAGCGDQPVPRAPAPTLTLPPIDREPTPAPHDDPPPPPAATDTFGAKHLLVQYQGAMRAPPHLTRTKLEARRRVEEAIIKARSGARFEDLVDEYSDEPGAKARGGDLGTFKRGQMVPQFQAAVESLQVGELSGVVETPFGFHLVLRTK
jgi:hypothetical protein